MTVRFAAIGLNHGHIYGQVNTLVAGGAEFVSFHATEPELIEPFQKRFPDAKLAHSVEEILEDPSIQLLTTAAIPCERAAISMAAMQHEKDMLSDKPGVTTFEQLEEVRRVQRETGRIYAILFGERMENAATMRASQLVQAGAIGRVVQTMGWGPHRAGLKSRAPWFFDRAQYGGILCDIGSHQCDQFLHFSGTSEVEVVSSQVGNVAHPEYSRFEDFGDATLRGKTQNGEVAGYFRVDWFTPDAVPAFGDGRLFVVGTEGTIEVRKYCDLTGRAGGNHLILVDNKEVRHIDCSQDELPFGKQFVSDVADRTETATTSEHCFRASELALRVQATAQNFGHLT